MRKSNRIFLWVLISIVPLLLLGILPLLRLDIPGFPDIGRSTALFTVLMILPFAVVFILVFKLFKKPLMAFFGGDAETRRILATGRSVLGTIRHIGESSLGGTITVNDQPFINLQVEVPDGPDGPTVLSIDTVIPRTAIPRFQPGMKIALKIDPGDPGKAVIDWKGGTGEGEPADRKVVGNVDGWTATDNLLLEREGLDGTAKILAVAETGKSQDYNPLVRITYEIRVPGKDPYTFTKDVPLPTSVAKKLKTVVRKTFPARIHPRDREKIRVELTF